MSACATCGSTNPEGQKFCGECGARLTPGLGREERKVVTALFCDLVGSTALGERLDPEDVSRLLERYQRMCRQRIETHGGVVEKFIGDAVVGVFGVPAAHEDDPERAVRAALRIVEDVRSSDLGIEVRIGVNTGEALARLDAGPGEGFATGDTMNTAARLEAAAPAMGVAVGAATHAATQGAIAYEELPPIAAKGKVDPVPAWRAVAAIARVGSTEHDATPFVGRDLELSELTRLAERSRTRGSVEFVTIVAEPGLGKSRLIRELGRHVDGLPELVVWREGRCLPYGDGISFWALGEIVRAQAGILETDDQRAVSDKLEAVLPEPDPQMRAWLKDRLAPLVGLETTTAPPERTEAFTAWRTFLETVARQTPTVLVIEDLHWADDAFVDFLGHLVERSVGVPLLVVITARPELEERHPSWPPGRRSTVLSLAPLDDADLTELIAASFEGASDELARVVLERAGGSPLFAEQLAAMLAEQALPIAGGALDASAIPGTVQALIAARIDALPPEPKRVLMEASVVGRTFWSGAIATLGHHTDLDGSLARLVRRELCRTVHPSTMEHEHEFSFWHALVRDVAYAALTKADRARMHAGVARWIAARAGTVLGEDAEIVVHHLDAARDLGSTEELDDLLADALVAAGEAAVRTDAPRAIMLMERALARMADDDPRASIARLVLARASMTAGDPAAARPLLEDLLKYHLSVGDDVAAVRVADDLESVLFALGERAARDAVFTGLRRRLEGSPSQALAELMALETGPLVGDRDKLELAQAALDLAVGLGVPPPASALGNRGSARISLGDLEAGLEDVDRSTAMKLEEGQTQGAFFMLYEGAMALASWRPRAGLERLDSAIALAGRLGADANSWETRALRMSLHAQMGRFDEVVADAEPVLGWARQTGNVFTAEVALRSLADVDLHRGSRAVPIDEYERCQRGMWGAARLFGVAELAFARGDEDRARALFEEAARTMTDGAPYAVPLALALGVRRELVGTLLGQDRSGIPTSAAGNALAEAALEAHDGRTDRAAERYADAAARFADLGYAVDQASALQGLGRCLLELRRTDEAVARLGEARELWVAMAATPRIVEVDELLARAG